MAALPQLGRYEILAKLATGGMAEIFLARLRGPRGFERAVVVKRVLPHLLEERQFREMFLDEARTVARIRHPNVVHVEELSANDREMFLVMEYLDGESLASLARRLVASQRTLPHALAAFVVAEICAGLHAAHELTSSSGHPLGLVHRDVSPQNAVVTYGGAVKVLDFGIAKSAAHETKTQTGVVRGTAAYMSPEQCLGQPLDRRSDIFSLGIVLYEIATGRRLFARDNGLLVMDAICEETVVPLHQIDGTFPRVLSDICAKALSRLPGERFATAADFRRELLAFVHAQLVGDPSEGLAELMRATFGDRIAAKEATMRRVAEGSAIDAAPPAETDLGVEIPVAVGGTRAGAARRDRASSEGRGRSRAASVGWSLGLVALLLVSVLAVGLYGRRRHASAETSRPIPSASAASSAVRVELGSMPSGALVRISGTNVGITPVIVEVARGVEPLELEMSLDGGTPVTQRFVPDLDQRVVLTMPGAMPSASPSAAVAAVTRGSPAPRRLLSAPRRSPEPAPQPPPPPSVVTPASPSASAKPFKRFE